MKINNEVYERMARYWWDENECGTLATIRTFVNTARFDYFRSILNNEFHNFNNLKILDVGCGGGFLSEEFSRLGLNVTGIDPSKETIKVAKNHAKDNNLKIEYIHGYGEDLPFESNTFSLVACCDVFEHVSDLSLVVKEISRVLKTGGLLFFDTINRTLISKIQLKALQEWKGTSFMEHNVHVWEMFIRPEELFSIFNHNNLKNIDIKGMSPSANILSNFINLRKCKKGNLSYRELGERLNISVSNNISGSYVGYAIKVE